MIEKTEGVQDVDGEVCMKLFNAVLKCREKALTRNSVNRLRTVFQIVQFERRLEKGTMSYINELCRIVDDESREEDEGSLKLRRHAKRSLTILQSLCGHEAHGPSTPEEGKNRQVLRDRVTQKAGGRMEWVLAGGGTAQQTTAGSQARDRCSSVGCQRVRKGK